MMSLKELVSQIQDGASFGFGGFTASRSCCAVAREMVRQKKRNLKFCGVNHALDIDLLCGCGCVSEIEFGLITFELFGGLCRNFVKKIKTGEMKWRGYSNGTLPLRLLAGALNLPFIPCSSLIHSDLEGDLERVKKDGKEYLLLPPLNPDVAVIHVPLCDTEGNAAIDGQLFHDIELAKASKKVFITAERIIESVPTEYVKIPSIYVDGVCELKFGSHPAGIYEPYRSYMREYEYDLERIHEYIKASKDEQLFKEYVEKYVMIPHEEYLKVVGLNGR